jgi:NTE family protein
MKPDLSAFIRQEIGDSGIGMPVEIVETGSEFDSGIPEAGIGLCLSGGGYRAMLFHLGALWRLNQFGYLKKLERISSVSGGSIIAGYLGLKWKDLAFGPGDVVTNFEPLIAGPIREMARQAIDIFSIFHGLFKAGSIAEHIAAHYKASLFGDATLQALPTHPTFVINATNIQTGALWRFRRDFMGDYRVGIIENPDLLLATAVAASSACPPFLSPVRLNLSHENFKANSGKDLQFPPYTTEVDLSDGGVYDNLGLETVWKRYDTVLISDGGGMMQPQPEPGLDWVRGVYRVNELIDNQVRALRKRQAVEAFALRRHLQEEAGEPDDDFQKITRKGAYWGIWTDIQDYHLGDSLDCPSEKILVLAKTRTRLDHFDDQLQEQLINWGYAVCDAAMRSFVDPSLQTQSAFPYPSVGVG